MTYIIIILVALSSIFEARSYYRQIRKIKRRHHSKDVSLKSYGDKLIKYVFGITALILAHNYVGLILEFIATFMCILTYFTIKRER